MTAPLLVFGWGNASRGDDALGPMFVQQLGQRLAPAAAAQIELLEDFQLQVEHVLDLVGRRQVLFVDASVSAPAPFELIELSPAATRGAGTHALSPQALLRVWLDTRADAPPPCLLLAMRAASFELGTPPSPAALANLARALDWAQGWVEHRVGQLTGSRSGST